MSYSEEFETVDLILSSKSETRGVDAFSLSLIKCERQIRRIFTHLVFQSPCFGSADINELRSILENNGGVYFNGFVRGIDELMPASLRELVGGRYDVLIVSIAEVTKYRNKIFHGQLTAKKLKRDDLIGYVDDMRCWCQILSSVAEKEIGYDGFGRNSFVKSFKTDLYESFKVKITSFASYREFIKCNMMRNVIA